MPKKKSSPSDVLMGKCFSEDLMMVATDSKMDNQFGVSILDVAVSFFAAREILAKSDSFASVVSLDDTDNAFAAELAVARVILERYDNTRAFAQAARNMEVEALRAAYGGGGEEGEDDIMSAYRGYS